jgi:hypothetical protein
MELTTPANDSGETAHEELVPGFSAEDDREREVDQTGVRILEARALEPVERRP